MGSELKGALATLEGVLRGRDPSMRVLRNEPMSKHTTLRIGGPADLFIEANCPERVADTVRACREMAIPLLVLGNGSNLLVRDGGVRGAVLHLGPAMAACALGDGRMSAQAGLTMAAAARAAAKAGLAGLCFAEGIPGSVGGGAAMNAGAYGGEMTQVVDAVEIVDGHGEARTLQANQLDYGYRHSALLAHGWIATRVHFRLAAGNPAALAGEMRGLAARRREKQPLQWPSAGSTFKRPPGDFAARLIEEAGLKGERVGGAEVSALHAGFLINGGGATAADMLALIARVRERVLSRSGVDLETEIRIVGDDG